MAALGACGIFLTLLVCWTVCLGTGFASYGDSVDRPRRDDGSGPPFRTKKVNLIWTKAKQRLSDETELNELYGDLKVYDGELISYKHKLHKEGDLFGDMEAQIREKLHDLMRRHGLWDHFDEDIKDSFYPNPDKIDGPFHDSRLEAILDKARATGFSEDELHDLSKEIQHHKDKLDEYRQLNSNMDGYNPANEIEEDSNRVEEKMADLSPEQHKSAKMELKQKHKDIMAGYDRITKLARDPSGGALDFTEPKVLALWADIVRANFSKEELESLKEEIRHFENVIQKQKAMAESASLLRKRGLEAGGHTDSWKDQHDSLAAKAERHQTKVDKYERDFKQRIKQSKHTEL